MNNKDYHSVFQIIATQLQIDGVSTSLDDTTHTITRQQLLIAIATRVEKMLLGNSELLFSTLYRLDIDERKASSAMKAQGSEGIALALAELILDREVARWQTRQAYRAYKEQQAANEFEQLPKQPTSLDAEEDDTW